MLIVFFKMPMTVILQYYSMISRMSSELHLGHTIGNQVSQQCNKSITNDFIKRVNILSAVFKFTFCETIYSGDRKSDHPWD